MAIDKATVGDIFVNGVRQTREKGPSLEAISFRMPSSHNLREGLSVFFDGGKMGQATCTHTEEIEGNLVYNIKFQPSQKLLYTIKQMGRDAYPPTPDYSCSINPRF